MPTFEAHYEVGWDLPFVFGVGARANHSSLDAEAAEFVPAGSVSAWP